MQETAISCSCCGWMLTMEEDAAVCLCPACGTTNARPVSTGSTLEALTRAVRQRAARDFHEAEISYQQVLLQNPDEHEALWGRLLCRYGVEYVEDPATHRRLPTVHSVQRKPMQEQADFRDACEYAPPEIAARYRQDAAYIDDAQAEIRRLAESCPPYDVFLCHKTTRIGSQEKTEDFHRAYQLYHFLKEQGVSVFFAPECLQTVAGANYEVGIYNALSTARVMLVVCSDVAHITSPWVRSEWTRFLDLADEDGEKRLIPLLYGGFDPSAIPQFRLRSLQGIDMSQLTASQTILTLVRSEKKFSAEEALSGVASALADGAAMLGKGVKAAAGKMKQLQDAAADKVMRLRETAAEKQDKHDETPIPAPPSGDEAQLLYTAPEKSLFRRSVCLKVEGQKAVRLRSGECSRMPAQERQEVSVLLRSIAVLATLILVAVVLAGTVMSKYIAYRDASAEVYRLGGNHEYVIDMEDPDGFLDAVDKQKEAWQKWEPWKKWGGMFEGLLCLLIMFELFFPIHRLKVEPGRQYRLYWKKGSWGYELVSEEIAA